MKSYKNQEAQLSTAELPDFMGAYVSKVARYGNGTP